MLSQCEGEWVWSSCTITVSTSGEDNCVISTMGDLGWSVQGKYLQEEDGSLVGQEITAVCQPLQVGQCI